MQTSERVSLGVGIQLAIVAELFDKCRISNALRACMEDEVLWFFIDSDKVLSESDDE